MPDEIPSEEVDLTQFEPEQFAELIAVATDEQLAELIHGPLRRRAA
jgi:hypothetical protein